MDKERVVKIVKEYIENSEMNYVQKDIALSKELVGMKIFDEPIFAFGLADEEGFKLLKNEEAIGEHFLLPKEWLSEANTVISYFLPFSETVIKSNREDKNWPSSGWLHGRIEGQKLINSLNKHLCDTLIHEGYKTIVPTQDSRFWSSTENHEVKDFTSNYSERHMAFVCGLGTFGLSKGIITEKGMAGRLGSVITSLKLEPSEKNTKIFMNIALVVVPV